MAEQRLMVASWRDPAGFYKCAEAYGLADHHFEDRLISIVLAYLVDCVERGEVPRLSELELAIADLAIPYDRADFHRIFVETTVPSGVDLRDLISDVLESSHERAERHCRDIAAEVLRAQKHVMTCPDCIRCCNGLKRVPVVTSKRRARRPLFEYV